MKMVILIMVIWILLILILLFSLLNQMEALITSLVMKVLKKKIFSYYVLNFKTMLYFTAQFADSHFD